MTAPDARLLLAAMAFEMTAIRRNYDGLPTEAILVDVIERCRAYDADCNRTWCQTSLLQLAAMNTFLGHGLLEPGCPQQVFWRDRTLQEYFAAVWLSRYCAKTEHGVEQLWSVICEDFPEAHGRRAGTKASSTGSIATPAEMPRGVAGHAESWIAAMEPLYRPGDGTAEGTHRWTGDAVPQLVDDGSVLPSSKGEIGAASRRRLPWRVSEDPRPPTSGTRIDGRGAVPRRVPPDPRRPEQEPIVKSNSLWVPRKRV